MVNHISLWRWALLAAALVTIGLAFEVSWLAAAAAVVAGVFLVQAYRRVARKRRADAIKRHYIASGSRPIDSVDLILLAWALDDFLRPARCYRADGSVTSDGSSGNFLEDLGDTLGGFD